MNQGPLRLALISLLTLSLSNLPSVAFAESQFEKNSKIYSTHEFLSLEESSQSQKQIDEFMAREDVQKLLKNRGISQEELQNRMVSLSQSERLDLIQQIEQAKYGGDILVTVLLIVLIIYLIKRI